MNCLTVRMGEKKVVNCSLMKYDTNEYVCCLVAKISIGRVIYRLEKKDVDKILLNDSN